MTDAPFKNLSGSNFSGGYSVLCKIISTLAVDDWFPATCETLQMSSHGSLAPHPLSENDNS